MTSKHTALFFISFLFLGACSHVVSTSQERAPMKLGEPQLVLNGKASWYGRPFHGRRTANGEVYDMYSMTAAHKSLPFGSLLRVTNINNQRELIVRVNDRGPFIQGRMLDLSFAAAKELEMLHQGVSQVRIEVYSPKKLVMNLASVKDDSKPKKTFGKL